MRRAVIGAAAVLALAVLVALGLSQAGTGTGGTTATVPPAPSKAELARRLAGAPPALAALHARANVLLPGAKSTLDAELKALKGHAVVVNKWASWCGPCRAEFPVFQRVGADFGKRVAFLGLDAGDNHDNATRFLARFPVSYPSVEDPNERAATSLKAGTVYPITIFYRADGSRSYIHQGGYATPSRLAADIERYALR
jgi:cytochrome c biogenesis protein CcmG/thiol:disulfide interchange protein DsbE